MNTPRPLYKTTLVIWSEYNPGEAGIEISALARDAETGESYCSSYDCELIDKPEDDPHWDGTEFFIPITNRVTFDSKTKDESSEA